MAFKLAEAFIEFASRGMSSVAADIGRVTSQSGVATSAVNILDAAITDLGTGAPSAAGALGGVADKAAAIKARLSDAVAEMNRLAGMKASGQGGPDIDAQLSKARGAVGGLSASLARFTGQPIAAISAEFGIASTKATEATGKTNQFAAALLRIKVPTVSASSFFSSVGSAASSAIGAVTSFKGMLLGAGAAAGAFSAVKMVGEAEQTGIAFEVMLGDAQAAKAMLGELRAFADKSPFSFPGVTDASRTLLQFGVTAGDVIPTIKRIGDVAAGDEGKMQSLSLAFGQMTSTGRLMGQDLNQMINVGFNPLQEISRTTGESMASLKKRMEEGGISAAMVAKAFETATSEGGKFHGMTERMSESTLGLYSTLKDNAGTAVRTMAEPFMSGINTMLKGAGGLLGNITAAVGPSFAILGSELSGMLGGVSFNFDGAGIGTTLGNLTQTVVGTFRSIYATVAPIVGSTVGFIMNTWAAVSPSLMRVGSAIVGAIGSVFGSAESIVGSINFDSVTSAIGLVAESFASAVEFVAPFAPSIMQVIGVLGGVVAGSSAVAAVLGGVGAAFAVLASPVGIAVAALSGFVLWLNTGSETANWFKDQIGSAFSAVGTFVMDAIDTVAFGFRNWETLLDLAVAHVGLFVDNTMARVSAFRENFIAVGNWIGENWLNIFRDMAVGTASILENIGKNLGEFFNSVKDWMSGKGWSFQSVGLLDGFTAKTSAMPAMVSPAIAATNDKIEGLYNKLAADEAAYEKRKSGDTVTAASVDTTDIFVGPQLPAGSGLLAPGQTKPQQPESPKESKASFLGFDMLAKRLGEQKDPLVEEQKRTNSLLEAGLPGESAANIGSQFTPDVVNATNSVIPDNWESQAAQIGASQADPMSSGFGWNEQAQAGAEQAASSMATSMTQPQSEPLKGTLEQQLASLAQAVTALQSLVDLAANKGIKTQGGVAVLG